MTRSLKTPFVTALIGTLALGAAGMAQAAGTDRARVIRSTPVVQQVAVPRQVCQDQVVTRAARTSGAGALVGGLAGGAIGNTIGDGSGRAIATAIGLVGGAVIGDRLEGRGRPVSETVTHCSTQTTYEQHTVGYDVTYEYAGRRYTTRMEQDPGRFVMVQVAPTGKRMGATHHHRSSGPVVMAGGYRDHGHRYAY